MTLKRLTGSTPSSRPPLEPASGGFLFTQFPDLAAFLSLTAWPDGKRRFTGTLTFFSEDGLWKVYVNDKDSEVGCCFSGSTLEEALCAASVAITTGQAAWRPKKRGK
jgi:predicted RNase H-like HicB family nuclease